MVGVGGKAGWTRFTSYLKDRSQRVEVNVGHTSSFFLKQEFPQGAVLVPFCLQSTPVERHFPVYIFTLTMLSSVRRLVQTCLVRVWLPFKAICDCIRDLRNWLVRDCLKMNDDKTEFLLIDTRKQLTYQALL